ncbi:MAG TPA: serine hydrolase [Planctomycetota bacterium]|nr:serine hydrolase [Planctomycetota bacterium]
MILALLSLVGVQDPPAPPAAFVAAAEYSQAQGGLTLAVRDAEGELVFEHYSGGLGPDNALPLYSAGHGLWAVAALAAEQDGLLELEAPVARWLSAWQGIVAKEEVLVRQLLDMTAGLDPNPKHVRSTFTADRYKAAVASRMTERAGVRFRFGPSTWMVFGALLGEIGKPREEDAFAYLKRRVLEPIGIQTRAWERDGVGNAMIPYGAYLTAREWSKLGAFLLACGRVGEEQVIEAERLEKLWRPCPVKEGYGLGFWRRSSLTHVVEEDESPGEVQAQSDATDLLAGLPEDIYFSAGLGGARLYVIPSRSLTVARHALETGQWSDVHFLRLLLDAPAPAPAEDGD